MGVAPPSPKAEEFRMLKLTDHTISRVSRLLESGRGLNEICRMPGLPNAAALHRSISTAPRYRARLLGAIKTRGRRVPARMAVVI